MPLSLSVRWIWIRELKEYFRENGVNEYILVPRRRVCEDNRGLECNVEEE